MVLVLAGTLEQTSMSLFDVQRKYFDSLIVMARFGPVAVPMPGASLLLAVLFVNLVVGGVIRIRKRAATVGILIGHVGILLLLLGGFVETLWSDRGFVAIREGESATAFQAYYDWEIAVTRRRAGEATKEYVLDADVLDGLDEEDVVRFTHADLPFDVVVSGWARNSSPRTAAPGEMAAAVEGILLESLPISRKAENNVPGASVRLVSRSGGPSERGLLWAWPGIPPWVVQRAGAAYEIDLRRRTWSLPFSVHLKKFVKRDHPGTRMAAEYSSFVTKVEGGVAKDVHITMNEPLRTHGYTLYQSGFNQVGSGWSSTFAVSRNPADRWPIASCAVIAFGLAWHFLRKLALHIARQSRSRAPAPKEALA
jgi:hypothetical protein